VCGVRAVDDQLCTRPVGAATNAAVVDALILDDAVPAYGTDVAASGTRSALWPDGALGLA
jgi:hypothetical protein